MTVFEKFRIDKRVVVITGGAGMLGTRHAETVAEAGGIPVLWDTNHAAAQKSASKIAETYACKCIALTVDITNEENIIQGFEKTIEQTDSIHVLINNAANDPKVEPDQSPSWSRVENFKLDMWTTDIAVGLTGAFLCSKHIGHHMMQKGGGIILNIASDLGIIAPDQRIYRKDDLPEYEQPVKPVTYSIIKHGIIGLTKYLATYWADKNIRVNSLSPGGVNMGQPEHFVDRLARLIPLGRMAHSDEYKAAVLFLISDASSYMTGANLIVDGGRTCW